MGGGGRGCIQEEAVNLPDATAMPEGAEYRREQRLERERGEARGGGGDCCLGGRSGGGGVPAWGGGEPQRWAGGAREEGAERERKRVRKIREREEREREIDREREYKKDGERRRRKWVESKSDETAERCDKSGDTTRWWRTRCTEQIHRLCHER